MGSTHRIVLYEALNVTAADPVLTLGVPVIAVPPNLPPVLDPLAEDVERLAIEVDLERVAALRPDLILSASFGGELFEGIPIARLEAIAPTVAYGFESDYAWRDYYRFFADAVGRTPEAEERLAALDERIAALAEALGDPAATSVSIVRPRGDGRIDNFRTATTFAGSLLDPIGFASPEAPDDLSMETIDRADADVLLVFAANEDDDDAIAQAFIDEPVVQQLDARIEIVGSHWFGFGLLAAQAVLDDVERLLA